VVDAAVVVTAESHKHAPPWSHLQSNSSHAQSALVQSTQQLQQEDAEALDLVESHFPADATKVTAPARIAIGRTLIANNLVNIWKLQKNMCVKLMQSTNSSTIAKPKKHTGESIQPSSKQS
jgi:hypothetical protein